MQSSSTPAKTLGYRDSLALTNRVLCGYRKVRELPVVVCSSIDPQIPPSLRQTPESIHFAVDVERITAKVLGDSNELQDAWFSMLNELPVDSDTGRRVALRCGRVYGPLDPHTYFRTVKRKRGETIPR
jgi:hypothetical protein